MIGQMRRCVLGELFGQRLSNCGRDRVLAKNDAVLLSFKLRLQTLWHRRVY